MASEVPRTCTECGKTLIGARPGTKTCTDKCRKKRSRRLGRALREHQELDEQPSTIREISRIVRHEAPDAVMKALHEELRPIVREAITEDVLRAVASMVGLTPRAVELLQQDMESEDPVVRQRAYTLVTKYTIGHPALLQPKDATASQMVINFGLPRPDEPEPVESTAEELEPQAEVTCDMCHKTKPFAEMVAGSTRCQACFEEWKLKVMEQFT